MPLPFEKQPHESNKAFAAFSLYLSLGAERSAREVAEKLAKSEQLIRRWAAKFGWTGRVAAYSAHLAIVEREAVEEARSQRDFGQQDQRLLPHLHRLRDCFEIDFGLAGAGDAVEQIDREVVLANRGAQNFGGARLGIAQLRPGEIDVGRRRDRLGRKLDRVERSLVD